MKTNGATWNAYLASWPEDQWFEDSDECFDGVPGDEFIGEVQDHTVVEFTLGTICCRNGQNDGKSLVSHFNAWIKARDTVSIVVTVKKDQEQALRDFVKSIKGKTQ